MPPSEAPSGAPNESYTEAITRYTRIVADCRQELLIRIHNTTDESIIRNRIAWARRAIGMCRQAESLPASSYRRVMAEITQLEREFDFNNRTYLPPLRVNRPGIFDTEIRPLYPTGNAQITAEDALERLNVVEHDENESIDYANESLRQLGFVSSPLRNIEQAYPTIPTVFNSQKCEIQLRIGSRKVSVSIASERHSYCRPVISLIPTEFGLVLKRELYTDTRPQRHPQPTFGLQLVDTVHGFTKILETKEES